MIVYFAFSFALSVALTLAVRYLAVRYGIVDTPDGNRKRHARPVPLLGGIAICIAFWVPVIYLLYHPVFGVELLRAKLIAAMAGSLLIVVIGIIDDIKPLPAHVRLLLSAVSICITVIIGGGLARLTNPWGGYFLLSAYAGGALVFFWLIGMTYTTKILDGLDGLSTGITLIGSGVIFFLTQTHLYYQPNVSLVSLIFAGACLGFLLFNFYPAKIFLGEGGSMYLGFMLGILAVIGGGKLATALLVMALPVFDIARVAFSRWLRGGSIFKGDRRHFHFWLVDSGVSQRKAVFIFYALSLGMGVSTLFLKSGQKIFALLCVFSFLVIAGLYVEKKSKPQDI